MEALELILVLLAVSAALQLVAERVHVPYPALLVLGGLGLAFIPALPKVTLAPDVLFLVFIPPLLYRASLTTSLRDFRLAIWPIIRLAILLVIVTTAAVALTAHALDAAFTWAAAFALGAIVSPPDPVAAIAVIRPLGAPGPIEDILEGEGLVNDAMAIVLYRMAVGAAVTGSFSISHAAVVFLLAGSGGVLIGLGVGWGIARLRRYIRNRPLVENTLSLLTPYIAFLPADAMGASGVLAVLATGLYLGRQGPRVVSAATRLQGDAMWSVLSFVLESLVFIFVGLELPSVMRALRTHPMSELLVDSAIVSAVVIAVRLAWVWPSAYLPRWLARRWFRSRRHFPPWRWTLFVGWAGMRGGDSLVIALSLPLLTAAGAPFPARQLIIFTTFAVILATLVLQGTTLAPLLHALHLRRTGEEEREEAHARLAAIEAGLARLGTVAASDGEHAEVARYLRQRSLARARRWAAREREVAPQLHDADASRAHRVSAPTREAGALNEARAETYRRLRGQMLDAERAALIAMRDRDEIADDVMRRVMHDLDLEGMLLESREPVGEGGREIEAE